MKRKIIQIDEEKCNGCGQCIPNCKEGALKVVDGKVRLISDLFCDGLGACVGHCPKGAITIIEREAQAYDEEKVMAKIVKQGENTVREHLIHLKEHNEDKLLSQAIDFLKKKKIKIPNMEGGKMKNELPCGCPGSAMREIKFKSSKKSVASEEIESELRQWPVQLSLLPVRAPFFEGSHMLVAADCTAFANPNFHSKLLRGKSIVIGCPKLDNIEMYTEKLTEIFKQNKVKSVTVATMEVPCCGGLLRAVEDAIKASEKKIPLISEVIMLDGTIQ
ncbi:MAG: 4Fe-4S binding protein [archaeon]